MLVYAINDWYYAISDWLLGFVYITLRYLQVYILVCLHRR